MIGTIIDDLLLEICLANLMYESTTYHLIQKIELMKNKIIALSCTAALLLFVSEAKAAASNRSAASRKDPNRTGTLPNTSAEATEQVRDQARD